MRLAAAQSLPSVGLRSASCSVTILSISRCPSLSIRTAALMLHTVYGVLPRNPPSSVADEAVGPFRVSLKRSPADDSPV